MANPTAPEARNSNQSLEAEPRFAELLEHARLLAVTLDREGRLTWCNDYLLQLTAYAREELLACDWFARMLPPEDADEARRDFARFMLAGEGSADFEYILLTRGGEQHIVRWTRSLVRDSEGKIVGAVSLGQDVTQTRHTEAWARRMFSLFQLLRLTNGAIVHGTSSEDLFSTVCRVAVEQGGLLGAWVGMLDEVSGYVTPVASHGVIAPYLKDILIQIDCDDPRGQGPTGTALREGRLVFTNDFQHDPRTLPWHEKGRAAGIFSSAAVPLRRAGRPVGTLTLYAGTTDFFSADIRSLIEEMARDISLALDKFASEAQEAAMRESLRLSEEKYRVLADHAQDWEYWMGTDGKYVYVSPACARVCGYEMKDFEDDPGLMERIIVNEDRALYARHVHRILGVDADREALIEFRIRHRNGDVRWIEHACHGIFRADGTWLGRRGLNRDITHRKQIEQQLQLTASVFENAREVIVLTDSEEKIIAVNPAFSEVTGYDADEAMGKSPRILKSGRHDNEFFAAMWRQVAQFGYWQGELWNRRKDGEIYPTLLVLTAVLDEHDKITHYIGISTDISRQKQSDELIKHMSDYDALTDLPNRALLRDRAERGIAMAQRDKSELALFYLDLDRFKTINDSLGHGVGDKLLQAIAKRLEAEIREVDTVGRLGGDEYLLILPRTDVNGAALLAHKLASAIAAPVEIDGHTLAITPSIGISLYPRDGEDFGELLKAANIAADKAKEAGRNTYQFFSPTMNEAAFQRLLIENALRHALAREEFRLHYQPQLSAQDGTVIGYEALIRWQHPEMGMISPLKFIPLAEETGLIEPIGAWVLGEACRQAKAWQDQGLPSRRMAVNFSSRQFGSGHVLETIEHALRESGLEPCQLEVEITESLLMRNPEQALETLRAIKSMGIHISIDDFGTGYSSLSYLKQFPIDKLKIDQSFVRHLTQDPSDASIVRAIIALAHSLRLETIAEGVETEAQFTFLRALGCGEIQGYLFSRPLPPERIPDLELGYRIPEESGDVPTLLLVSGDASAPLEHLRDQGYRVLTTASGEEGLEILARNQVHVVLAEQGVEGMSGGEFLSRVRTIHPDTVRIFLSGHGDIDWVSEALGRGEIYRNIAPPWRDSELLATIRDAFEHFASSK